MKKLFFLILTILALKANAQTTFSGNWRRTERISLSGNDYSNGVPIQLQVKQTADSIAISRVTELSESETSTVQESVPLSGKAVAVKVADKQKLASIKWDKTTNSFTETGVYSDPQQPDKPLYKTSEVWTLSADGNTLSIVKTFASTADANDQWSMKGVYQKQ